MIASVAALSFSQFTAPEVLEALKVDKQAAICHKRGHVFVFPIVIFSLLICVGLFSLISKVSQRYCNDREVAFFFLFILALLTNSMDFIINNLCQNNI